MTAAFDSGNGVNLVAGYDFDGPGLEMKLSYRKNTPTQISAPTLGNTATSGKTGSQAVLLNGYYNFHTGGLFTPFAMADIGYARVKISGLNLSAMLPVNSDYDDNVLAWQFGPGISSAIGDHVTQELSWRHFQTASPKSGTSTTEYRGQSILAGVRYAF